MTTTRTVKLKKGKVEFEVEKLRAESQWIKALELICLHPVDRSSPLYLLHQLILCEYELEGNDQYDVSPENLKKALNYTEEVLKTNDEQYKIEASILAGKIYYLQNKLKEAENILSSLKLTSNKLDSTTLRYARLISEGLAILGLCREESIAGKGEGMPNNERERILMLYDLSSRICIRHLQDLDRTQVENNGSSLTLPFVVEKVVQKIPAIILKNGNINGAICQFRSLLGYCETPATRSLRQALGVQFAELLLRSSCGKTYQKYNASDDQESGLQNDSQIVPYKYSAGRFIPENQMEEAVVALMISEHIACQDVILNRPSESSETQIVRSFNNIAAVYDLLAIALTRVGHLNFLAKSLEKALKFSYHQFHIWHQFALTLISSKQYYRGYLALRECLRIDNTKLSVYFLASTLCIGYLGFIEEGMELAYQVTQNSTRYDRVFLARAHLLLGWGWSVLARSCYVADRQNELRNRAMKEYQKSTQLDPNDYLSWYHLAVELATQRHLDEALSVCQHSLQLMPIHSNTLCLLALLHTAGGKRMEQASKALYVGLTEKPNDFNLLFLLAKVETIRLGPKAGLKIHRRLLELWRDTFLINNNPKSLFDRAPRSTLAGRGQLSPTGTNEDYELPCSPSVIPSFELGDDSSTFTFFEDTQYLETGLANIAIGNVGQIGASIAPVPTATQAINTENAFSFAMKIQVKIYQCLAETYLKCNQLLEAKEALDEATKIGGMHNQTLFLRGCLAEKQGHICKARSFYENVVAIKPNHLKALLSLATLLYENNQMTLAERIARDAMNVDPTNFNVWRLLADILKSPHTSEPASETVISRALLTAIDLEQSEPTEPFYSLPLGIRCT